MTTQYPEIIYYKGAKHSMYSEPLTKYFQLTGIQPHFEGYCTALWRKYIGTWEVIDGRLHLIKLVTGMAERDVQAEYFPEFPTCAFAYWFTGKVRLPQGELLKRGSGGYQAVYESDMFLHFENGVLIKEELVVNEPHHLPGGKT